MRYIIASLKQRKTPGLVELGKIADSLIQSKDPLVQAKANFKISQKTKSEKISSTLTMNDKAACMQPQVPSLQSTADTIPSLPKRHASKVPVDRDKNLLRGQGWPDRPRSKRERDSWHSQHLDPAPDQLEKENLSDLMPNLDYLSFGNEEPPELNLDPYSSDSLRSSSESERQTELSVSLKYQAWNNEAHPIEVIQESASNSPNAARKQWASGSWTSLPTAHQAQAGTQDLLGLSSNDFDSGAEFPSLDLSTDDFELGISTLDSWATTDNAING